MVIHNYHWLNSARRVLISTCSAPLVQTGECKQFSLFDLDLWPMTYNPRLANVKVDPHAENQAQRSNGSNRRAPTDKRMDTHRRYQTYYRPCYAVNDKKLIYSNVCIIMHNCHTIHQTLCRTTNSSINPGWLCISGGCFHDMEQFATICPVCDNTVRLLSRTRDVLVLASVKSYRTKCISKHFFANMYSTPATSWSVTIIGSFLIIIMIIIISIKLSTVGSHAFPLASGQILYHCDQTITKRNWNISDVWKNANRSSVMTCISVLGTIASASLPLESLITDIFLKHTIISRVWPRIDLSRSSMSPRLPTCWLRVVTSTLDVVHTCTEQDDYCSHHHHQ